MSKSGPERANTQQPRAIALGKQGPPCTSPERALQVAVILTLWLVAFANVNGIASSGYLGLR